MTPLLVWFLPWFSEFCLEVAGAIRSRKKYPVLCAVFLFSALADIGNYLLHLHRGWFAYSVGYWFQKGGKYVLLTFLAAWLASKLLHETRWKTVLLCGMGAVLAGAVIVGMAYSDASDIADKLKDASITANMVLAWLLAAAWFARSTRLDRAYSLMTWALIGLLLSDAILSYVWKFWEPARHYFWIAEILSLGVWNVAAGVKLESFTWFRRELGQRAEALPERDVKGAVQ